jgi:hypothetical protein
MTPPQLTVAEVIRSCLDEFLEQYGSHLTSQHRRVLTDLISCRTAALGGHVLGCPECGHQQIAYNSCGNRHCATCQAMAAARWLDAQTADLLRVPYFHLVFTLPNVLDPIALRNRRLVYDLLMRCAGQTVLDVAANPKHLGAETGMLAVLHTWGQTLQFHPHVHCIVPGGGVSPDGTHWVASADRFFLPDRVLSKVFRGKFLEGLREAHAQGKLVLGGPCSGRRNKFERLVAAAARTDWVMHAKPPFGGPVQVLKYLARYTHRVAISNRRLLELRDGKVRFRNKDYAHRRRKKVMELSALEFVRRLLLHVLPVGFVRIRRYGFLSNRQRREKLALCRHWLEPQPEPASSTTPQSIPCEPVPKSGPASQRRICPVCGVGEMIQIQELPRRPLSVLGLPNPTTANFASVFNTS